MIKGELYPKLKLNIFYALNVKIINMCLKNKVSILKNIIWETQKWNAKYFLDQ